MSTLSNNHGAEAAHAIPRTQSSKSKAKAPAAPAAVAASPGSLAPGEGPLLTAARHLQAEVQAIEARYELDELDRLARRYARGPASGAEEALLALAEVVAGEPLAFAGSEINLDPPRLRAIVDRERGLRLLRETIERFQGLVKDSQQEQGDEIVELLEVGLRLAPARASASGPLHTLRAYHQRVRSEDAHKGEIERAPSPPPSSDPIQSRPARKAPKGSKRSPRP